MQPPAEDGPPGVVVNGPIGLIWPLHPTHDDEAVMNGAPGYLREAPDAGSALIVDSGGSALTTEMGSSRAPTLFVVMS